MNHLASPPPSSSSCQLMLWISPLMGASGRGADWKTGGYGGPALARKERMRLARMDPLLGAVWGHLKDSCEWDRTTKRALVRAVPDAAGEVPPALSRGGRLQASPPSSLCALSNSNSSCSSVRSSSSAWRSNSTVHRSGPRAKTRRDVPGPTPSPHRNHHSFPSLGSVQCLVRAMRHSPALRAVAGFRHLPEALPLDDSVLVLSNDDAWVPRGTRDLVGSTDRVLLRTLLKDLADAFAGHDPLQANLTKMVCDSVCHSSLQPHLRAVA